MNTVRGYIEKFGPEAGPKIYHLVRSRAAHKGVSTKRRQWIEALTGRTLRPRRKSVLPKDQRLLPLTDPAEHGYCEVV